MSNQRYILAVDDSKADAMMLQRVILKSGVPLGFRWISNAEVALETLLKENLHHCILILLDIKMPLMTGLEILENLHANDRLKTLPPISIFSSSNQDRDIKTVSRYPGVSYQIKPEGYLAIKAWLTPQFSRYNPKDHD